MFCCSAGLLIDLDLAEAILSGRYPLNQEWQQELKQQYGWRSIEPGTVLLVAGVRWQPGARPRDQAVPCCHALPSGLRPLLEDLAETLEARLFEVADVAAATGLCSRDLLEAPLLLIATQRPPELLLGPYCPAYTRASTSAF